MGNDVNRPLLEQLAEDSGGLAAFISPGDNFARQARAFRQKIMRPFATGLELKFAGIDVTELEPKTLPNLYSGAPVRLYGRYRGSGPAEVTLRASVNGKEVKQAATLEFPKTDSSNPEINRLWAWHRINRLLKDADRQGDRGVLEPGGGFRRQRCRAGDAFGHRRRVRFPEAQDQLSGALSRLLVVAENYPQLKANENFLALQTQLEGTENRITVKRRNSTKPCRNTTQP